MSAAYEPMSEKDFAELGTNVVVYIRPVKLADGSRTFAVHAADGEKLAHIDTFEHAVVAAHSQQLQPVSVH